MQWKGDKNANLSSVLNKAGPQHKTELIKLLIALSQEYPINNAGSDLQALIVDGECLWSDGTIESLPDTQTVIDKYLTGKEILVGEKPTFTLDE
ncbi:hypothetical protein FACS1894176_00440 [Bacteroidia bacterium]|nr:hypothetical protein FACS189428_7880 [Clostridia bacterium]GHV24344.1 hypothetical protein FACS1894176_00440 [Bacteroidia bacterium]